MYVTTCDGCGRELGQGYGHRETYDTQQEADTAARVAGWTAHPGGTHYCQEGEHQ
ncbi:hypothetical protein [Kitasatospora sp. NBC_01302]|uniref:hypothetical protein n=1 Tax=Kitasatospora sp. NBC_01302 TaxID=2903575 RepID=UPI002E136D77|nr:hypothetical protein OG294_13985 [Kitasatospora sp. NBC_01302]